MQNDASKHNVKNAELETIKLPVKFKAKKRDDKNKFVKKTRARIA